MPANYDEMPTPGTAQWGRWFSQLQPQDQQQVIFDFGMDDANQPVMGSGVGGMTPEIGTQAFGMLNQLESPPVINSKGVIQPQGTEQKQKELNLFQDQQSLLTDNVLAAIAGQYSPTAFTPTYEGTGNPVQQTGTRALQAYAGGGGYQGFMSDLMLPKELGGKGMTPGQAKSALIQFIKLPESDSVSPEAKAQRDEILGSLDRRVASPTKVGETPMNRDLTTDEGITNTFDFSGIDSWANQTYKDLITDPIAAYTDPKTGLAYTGAKEIKTPTMEWFDKYGLPYANQRYDDPDQIRGYQDAVAPVAAGQLEAEDQQRTDALAANQAARDKLGLANSQMDILQKAYTDAMKPGNTLDPNKSWTVNQPIGTPTQMTPRNGSVALTGQMTMPKVVGGDISKNPMAKFLMDVDAQGNLTGLSADQRFPAGAVGTAPTPMGGGLSGATQFTDWTKPGAILPNQESDILQQARGMLPQQTGGQASGNRKVMQIADLQNYANRIKDAQHAAAATVPGIQAAGQSSDASMQRQLARARMMGMASTGRTPLSDTLAGRIMAARAAGVYR